MSAVENKTTERKKPVMRKVPASKPEAEAEELPSGNDLYQALKSCEEIGSAKTLFGLIKEVSSLSKNKIPTKEYKSEFFGGNYKFKEFLRSVIVCTEQGSDEGELARLA